MGKGSIVCMSRGNVASDSSGESESLSVYFILLLLK